MASVSDILGVQWHGPESGGDYSLHPHAAKQARAKGFNPTQVLAAANSPTHTYPNGRYPGQMRHVRHGVVAVVDPKRKQVVTVYADQVETAQRADQNDKDANRYGATSWLRKQAASRTVGGAS